MHEKILLRQGAEANLYKSEYLGKEALIKERIPKDYRNAELDSEIRKRRTKEEAQLLYNAKALGVRTPLIYKIDLSGATIIMEFIEGKRMKDALNGKNLNLCKLLGNKIGILHSNGIVHGDLTTSNIIIHNNAPVFIDFGLGFHSRKTEDFAVDLLNFRKTYNATHYKLGKGWNLIVRGYIERRGNAGKEVVGRIPKIEERGRYL
ncbi:MAG: Kae1-associated serine/threonine protein kinase [Candidatus Diapherotrites archaeon]|nr:Kae1-associated serine/threonine protein kinase [Candidatus Diapherotrites archaeon]